MRNKLVVVLLLIVAAIVVAPWVDGMLLKQNYYKTVAILNADNQLKVKILKYEQGWLSSSAKIQLEPSNMTQAPAMELGMLKAILAGIIIEQHFSHGPIVFDPVRKQWAVGLGAFNTVVNVEMLKQFLGSQAQQGLLRIETLVGLSGDYLSQIQAPPITTEIPQVVKLSWGGMTGTIHVYFAKNHLSRISSNLMIGAFQMTGPQNQSVNIASYSMNSDIHRLPTNLWDGRYVLNVPSAKVVITPEENVQIEGLSAQSTVGLGQSSDLYNVQLNLDMNKFIMPEMTVNPFNLKLALNALDANVLAQLIKTPMNEAQSQSLFPRLITSSTILSGQINLNTPFGHFTANGQVNWLPNALPARPDEVIMKSNAKAEMHVSVALVDQILEIMDSKAAMNADSQAAAATAPVPPPTAASSSLLDDMVAQNKLTQAVADQLKNLQTVDISSDVYASTVDTLVANKQISADIAGILKSSYAQAKQQAANPAPAQTAPAQSQGASAPKPSDQVRQQISDNIKQGFIIEKDGEYIVMITSEQGAVKVNGKDYQMKPVSLNAEPLQKTS